MIYKFRAYDPDEGKMHYNIALNADGVVLHPTSGCEKYDWIPMMFTNILDCDGIDIYQGDIVIFHEYHYAGACYFKTGKGEVVFDKAKFMIKSESIPSCWHELSSDVKIIGNKYEK